jgi:ABC-type branched-subunit amino acid transport system ATPase component
MDNYFLNPANFEAWLPPAFERPMLWGRYDLTDERWLYLLALVMVVVAAAVVYNLRQARPAGRSRRCATTPRAPRRSGSTCSSPGSPVHLRRHVRRARRGIHAVALRGIGAETYPAEASLLLFSMAVIGGTSSIGGTLAGVALVQWVGYLFPKTQILLTGVGLLIILWFVPGGLSGLMESIRDASPTWWPGGGAYGSSRSSTRSANRSTASPPRSTTPVGMGASSLLTCEAVESSYGSLQVLFGIDTVVGQGELLALLGTNGAGKSTLLRSISGLLPPHGGRVVFDGHDITGLPAERVARLGLSLVPGGHGVFPTLTVGENLRLACWMLRHDPRSAESARRDVMAMFPVLGQRQAQLAGDLSGGEQQQLSLAMAFVTRPKLLCIDELSIGLAPTVVDRLIEKVRDIHARGTTVVVVEQSVNVALLLCHRALFLEKGQVRFRGPTAGLLDRPDILRAVFIGGDKGPRDGIPAAPQSGPPPWERASRGVTLEARAVSKRFGGIRALDDVYLTIHPATIVGLIGHNGAGKTTLFDVLTGFLRADGGEILLNGVDITHWPPHRRAIAEVGRTFQEALTFPSLTVEDAIAVSLEQHLANRDPLAAALRLPAVGGVGGVGGRAGGAAHRAARPRRLRRPAHGRAVHRHQPDRGAGLHPGPGPGRRPVRRAVVGRGPARDRGARSAAAPGPGRDRLLDGDHRARHVAAGLAVRRLRGPGAGRGHSRRDARGGPVRPAGHHVLPGNQRGRCAPLRDAAGLVLQRQLPASLVVSRRPRPRPEARPRARRCRLRACCSRSMSRARRRGGSGRRPRSRPLASRAIETSTSTIERTSSGMRWSPISRAGRRWGLEDASPNRRISHSREDVRRC